MKILILYYSGAGTTKFIASLIENELIQRGHNVKSIRITEQNINSLTDDFDMLYLGFPIYFRDAPELVYKVFEKISGKNRPVMMFFSRGLYSGNAFKNIHRVSTDKEFVPIGYLKLLMPGADFLTSTVKAGSFSERLYTSIHSKNIREKIKKNADKAMKNKEIKTVHAKWYTFFDEQILKKLEIKANNAYKDWIKDFSADTEKCIQCMKCVNGCPRNNIKYVDKILFGTNCDVCLYCISNCSKTAINISQKTIGKTRYSEEKIKQVFKHELSSF